MAVLAAPYINIHNHHSIDKDDRSISVYSFFAQDYEKALNAKGCFTIGLHPWHAELMDIESALDGIEQVAALPNCIGIGEIGLDHVSESPLKKQLIAFEQQLLLAQKLQLPVIIHNVRSLEDILRLIKKTKFSLPVIYHGFTGKPEMAQQIDHTGAYISFGKSIMQPTKNNVISSVPLKKVFFETDESAYTIEDIYKQASVILNIPITSLNKTIYTNFITVFTKYHG